MSLFPLFSFAFLHSSISNISGLDAPTQKGATTLPSYTSPLAADTTTPDFVAHAPNAHSYHSWPSRYGQLITTGSFLNPSFFFGLFRILDLSKRANSDFSSAFPGFRDERGILEISATPPTEDERECTEAPVPQHACTFLEGGGRVEVNTTTERGKTGERMGREMMEIDTMMDMGHMGTMITNSSRTTTPSFTNSYLVEPEGTGFKSNDFCDGTA